MTQVCHTPEERCTYIRKLILSGGHKPHDFSVSLFSGKPVVWVHTRGITNDIRLIVGKKVPVSYSRMQ